MSFFGEYKTTRAQVVAIAPRTIQVETTHCDNEKSCHGCSGCATSERKPMRLSVPRTRAPQGITAGDLVRLTHFATGEALSAAIIFGLPLLFGLLALVFWYLLSPQRVESSPAVFSTIGAGAAGFAAAAGCERLIQVLHPPQLHPEGTVSS